MGKPFSQELKFLKTTFEWSVSQDVLDIQSFKLDDTPVLVVGSGGSLSACYLVVNLLHHIGIIAKAVTPFELQSLKNTLRKSRLIFISAGGKNTDIMFAYKTAIEFDPVGLLAVCMRANTPLGKLSSKYSTSKTLEYKIPSGKDGFLATNSLIAYFTLFIRGLHNDEPIRDQFSFETSKEIEDFANSTTNDTTISILYGGWGHPVAIDIESKFTEAALGNVHMADYRNFAHGRHHWFAKRSANSALVAIVTPDEEMLAKKTLDLLPKSIPKLFLRSNLSGPNSSIDLLIKSFRFIEAIGHKRNIDPGRPGVPPFGRKLYNLKYSSLLTDKSQNSKKVEQELLPILRKAKVDTRQSLTSTQFQYWTNACKEFKKRLTSAKFGVMVFDYDGTLCRPSERFKRLPSKIKSVLNTIVKNGFVVGVVTGRGQSVRNELQSAIDKAYWKQVIVGYYNGADVGSLENNKLPIKEAENDRDLLRIYDVIREYPFPFQVDAELRPKQLTIQINDQFLWKRIRPLLLQLIMSSNTSNLQVLESSHSMDVIKRPSVSKLNILQPCVELAKQRKVQPVCLCIGDRGQWPGNDFELLATPYSLSVDEVSSERDYGWNMAPAGIKGVDATLVYLNRIEFSQQYFKLKI